MILSLLLHDKYVNTTVEPPSKVTSGTDNVTEAKPAIPHADVEQGKSCDDKGSGSGENADANADADADAGADGGGHEETSSEGRDLELVERRSRRRKRADTSMTADELAQKYKEMIAADQKRVRETFMRGNAAAARTASSDASPTGASGEAGGAGSDDKRRKLSKSGAASSAEGSSESEDGERSTHPSTPSLFLSLITETRVHPSLRIDGRL